MKIKEFFENYRHIYNIDVPFMEKDNRLEGGKDIYTSEEFNKFIEDYGDKEFKEWSVENIADLTQFYFFLN